MDQSICQNDWWLQKKNELLCQKTFSLPSLPLPPPHQMTNGGKMDIAGKSEENRCITFMITCMLNLKSGEYKLFISDNY